MPRMRRQRGPNSSISLRACGFGARANSLRAQPFLNSGSMGNLVCRGHNRIVVGSRGDLTVSRLYGSLEGVDLFQSMRLLGQLHATGCLRVSQDGGVGQIAFQDGRVVSASMGAHAGVTALTTMLLVAGGVDLTFYDQSLPAKRNIDMGTDELLAYLQMVARLGSSQPQGRRTSECAALTDESPSGEGSNPNSLSNPDCVSAPLTPQHQRGQASGSEDPEVQTQEAIAALVEYGLTGGDAAKLDSAVSAEDESRALNSAIPAAPPAASKNGHPPSTTTRGNGYQSPVASGPARARSIAAKSPASSDACPKLG